MGIVREDINFERGQDPIKAMGIGMTPKRVALKFMEETEGYTKKISEKYFGDINNKENKIKSFLLYYFFARIAYNDNVDPQIAFNSACNLESGNLKKVNNPDGIREDISKFILDTFGIEVK
jgi:hypothetical protein